MVKDSIVQECLLKLLRQIRSEADLTQVELADRLDQPQSFVSKYESGDRRMDVVELRRVCSAVGLDLEEFSRRLEEMIRAAR